MGNEVNLQDITCEEFCKMVKETAGNIREWIQKYVNYNLQFKKKLSSYESDTFRKKFDFHFKDISGNYAISDEFIINSKSLKEILNGRKNRFVHFYFIHLKQGYTGLEKYVNNLYYLIIISSKPRLLPNHIFQNDEIYIIDGAGEPIPLKNLNFENIKEDFFNGVGKQIKKKTKINNITEYITYKIESVCNYLTNTTSGTIWLRMLCIDGDIDCSEGNCTNIKDSYEKNANRLLFAVYDDINARAIGQPPGNNDDYDAGDLNP